MTRAHWRARRPVDYSSTGGGALALSRGSGISGGREQRLASAIKLAGAGLNRSLARGEHGAALPVSVLAVQEVGRREFANADAAVQRDDRNAFGARHGARVQRWINVEINDVGHELSPPFYRRDSGAALPKKRSKPRLFGRRFVRQGKVAAIDERASLALVDVAQETGRWCWRPASGPRRQAELRLRRSAQP